MSTGGDSQMKKSDEMGFVVRGQVSLKVPSNAPAEASRHRVPPVGLDWWTEAQSAEIRSAIGTKKFTRQTAGIFSKLALK